MSNSKGPDSSRLNAVLILLNIVDFRHETVAVMVADEHFLTQLILTSSQDSYSRDFRICSARLLFAVHPAAYLSRHARQGLCALKQLHPFIPLTALECAICFAVDHEAHVFLPCMHGFHGDCLISWFATGKDACPVCKTNLPKTLISLTNDMD